MKRFLMALILLTASVCVFAQNSTAVIREITGTVEIKRSGSANWITARTGTTINRNDIISTSFRSTAVVAAGSSTIVVQPLTRLSLQEIINQSETETVNLNLSTGRVRVDVNPPAGRRTNMSVQTPSSTASVRGTSFEMDTTSIRVLTGSVSYAPSAGRPVTVSAGQESWVDDSGNTVNPMAAAESSRFLPVLPGQSTTTPESASLNLGTLLIDVIIVQ
ncbi:MAG: FecR domain-containing protein [Treponema sp.]|nr:FecR domain-containing protein [Treponema sp.]